MMDWQTLIALSIVALAGLALLPRFVGMFRANQKPGCGSCGCCSSDNAKIIQKPLVGLKEIADRRK